MSDPTEKLRAIAASMPNAVEGTSCNQTSFKVGKTAFLYVGPGPKGQGYKAMFKLGESMGEAQEMARKAPDGFQIGTGNWVTARFSEDHPMPQSLWTRWLAESYAVATKRR